MSAKLCAVFVPNILPGAGAWYTGAETGAEYDGVQTEAGAVQLGTCW